MGNLQSIASPSPVQEQEQPLKEGEEQVRKQERRPKEEDEEKVTEQEQPSKEDEKQVSPRSRNVPYLASENLPLKKRSPRIDPRLIQYEPQLKKDKKKQHDNEVDQLVLELTCNTFEEISMLEKMHHYYIHTNTQPYFCSKASRDFIKRYLPLDLSEHDFVRITHMLRDKYEARVKHYDNQADQKAFHLANRLWGSGDLKACGFSDEGEDPNVYVNSESEERKCQTVQERVELWSMYGDDTVKNLIISSILPKMLPQSSLPSSNDSVPLASHFYSLMENYKRIPKISPQVMLPQSTWPSIDSIPPAPFFSSLTGDFKRKPNAYVDFDSGSTFEEDYNQVVTLPPDFPYDLDPVDPMQVMNPEPVSFVLPVHQPSEDSAKEDDSARSQNKPAKE